VCSGEPIVRTASVTAAALQRAVGCTQRQQRAAIDGAFVTASIALASKRAPRYSIASLTDDFGRLGHVGFRDEVTASGVTVLSKTSEACLAPTSSATFVRVVLGPCH
jgi:hypothetical protein